MAPRPLYMLAVVKIASVMLEYCTVKDHRKESCRTSQTFLDTQKKKKNTSTLCHFCLKNQFQTEANVFGPTHNSTLSR
jgi:hypothetical protein